jgi:hypothetical protein
MIAGHPCTFLPIQYALITTKISILGLILSISGFVVSSLVALQLAMAIRGTSAFVNARAIVGWFERTRLKSSNLQVRKQLYQSVPKYSICLELILDELK